MQLVKDNPHATVRPEFDRVDLFSRLTIVLLPFVLLAINDNWVFSKPVWIDRWIYSGFHLHLPEFLRAFGNTYYASRLPWTAAGWVLHSVFDDATALCVLHFAVFYLAVFSLYAAVRAIFANNAAAGAAALLMGTHTYFLMAVGWDYVDGASLACMLAGFAALAGAAIMPHWRLAAFLWGVSVCAMVSMYILLVLLVPVQIGLFLLLNRFRGKRSNLAATALFVAGGLVAMLLLGLINWLFGGPFHYWMGQINSLLGVANNRSKWEVPFVDWASSAPWLFVAVCSFAFSFAYVLLHFKSVSKKMHSGQSVADTEVSLFLCCLADVAASLIYAGLQADRFYVLQMDYNADALLPFAYLTIGGALAAMIKASGRPSRQLGFLSVVAAIVVGPWILATLGYIFPRASLFDGLAAEIGWVAMGSALLLLVVQKSYRLWGAVLAIAFFSIVNLGAPSHGLDYPPDPAYKLKTLAVYDASRSVSHFNPDARARFWFNENDPQAALLRDVVSSYLYAYRLVNDQFPSLIAADGRTKSVEPGQRIILLTSTDEDVVALANAAVANQNLLFEQVARVEIRRAGVAFHIIVTDVKISPAILASARLLSSETIKLASAGAFLQRDPSGIAFRSVSAPWSYVGRMPLFANCLAGGGWVAADINVTHGIASVGVLNRNGDAIIDSGLVSSRSEIQTIFLRLDSFAAAGDFILRNGNESSFSEGVLGEVRIASADGQTPPACDPNPARTKAISQARALSLESMTTGSPGAWLQLNSSGVSFRSVAAPWAYIGRMPLFAECLAGGGWIAADISVMHGSAGVGVLNRRGDDFLDSGSVVADGKMQTVFLRVASFAAAGDLVVRNWDEPSSSEGTLKAIRIASEDGQTPATCASVDVRKTAMAQARSLSLEAMTLGSRGASLLPNASGVEFRSAPDPWSYIGRMPLLAGCIQGGGWVAADVHVMHGTVGIGVLNRKGDDFLVSDTAIAGDTVQTVFLRVASFAAAGDLVVRNWDEPSSSEGTLKAIRIATENGELPAVCDAGIR
jgi:hypothetical protein